MMERENKAICEVKESSGITLIALVVTIVVLVILGTISMIGILRRKWINCESTKRKRYS